MLSYGGALQTVMNSRTNRISFLTEDLKRFYHESKLHSLIFDSRVANHGVRIKMNKSIFKRFCINALMFLFVAIPGFILSLEKQ